MDKQTMICGLDDFHATYLGKKSVLALICSMNNSATTYWSTSVAKDDFVQEGSNNLCNSMAYVVDAIKRANEDYKKQIIFYRDGVCEGQIEGIFKAEIAQINQAFPIKSFSDSCKMMYLNTSKKMNTRLFTGDLGRF